MGHDAQSIHVIAWGGIKGYRSYAQRRHGLQDTQQRLMEHWLDSQSLVAHGEGEGGEMRYASFKCREKASSSTVVFTDFHGDINGCEGRWYPLCEGSCTGSRDAAGGEVAQVGEEVCCRWVWKG